MQSSRLRNERSEFKATIAASSKVGVVGNIERELSIMHINVTLISGWFLNYIISNPAKNSRGISEGASTEETKSGVQVEPNKLFLLKQTNKKNQYSLEKWESSVLEYIKAQCYKYDLILLDIEK